jgi:hypothetical protein
MNASCPHRIADPFHAIGLIRKRLRDAAETFLPTFSTRRLFMKRDQSAWLPLGPEIILWIRADKALQPAPASLDLCDKHGHSALSDLLRHRGMPLKPVKHKLRWHDGP